MNNLDWTITLTISSEVNFDELKNIRNEMFEICEYNRTKYIQMLTSKYTFNGDSMNNYKEILSIINQIKLGII